MSQSTWRRFLACRKCKKAITSYLAEEFLHIAPGYLTNNQEFVTNIKETAFSTNQYGELLQRPSYYTNMEEADMRIWLHCVHCAGRNILIYSPDTDVYHVGTGLQLNKHVIVQLSRSLISSPRLLDLNELLNAIDKDPDLSGIPSELRPQAFQSLYVCSGCDYVSFFAGIGKSSFLSTFYQYGSFIAGGIDQLGSLGKISPNPSDPSLYSFLRLVGCAYFRSHTSAFTQTSPVSLYHSVTNMDTFKAHDEWLDLIRRAVWLRADNEAQNMPSTEALRLHWNRCLWVLNMLHSSTENEVELPGTLWDTTFLANTYQFLFISSLAEMNRFGWKRNEGKLEVIWDSPENIELVHQRVQFVLSGCRCKTGCTTRRCKCTKEGRKCGPGCRCTGCRNTTVTQPSVPEELFELEADDFNPPDDGCLTDESDDLDEQAESDCEEDELMRDIFGSDGDSDEEL